MTDLARRLNRALARLVGLRHAPVGLLVGLLALAAFLPAFTTLPPVDRDEARFAQAAKQMVESGDFVDIRFQDRPRYKKPVGIYWLQSAAVAAIGGSAEPPGDRVIWHYRLPSLIAAVLAAVLTARIAMVFGGAAAGLAAGLPMAGTFLLGAEAHLATTDAVLLLTILAAQFVLARLYRDAREGGFAGTEPLGWGSVALFWGALAAGTLVKGPIAPGIVALTVLALALGHRRARWLKALRPGPGLLLWLALVAPWFVAITWRSGMGFWDAALGRDLLAKVASAQEEHGAPPGSYLAMLWFTFQPAAIALALALPAIWRGRHRAGIAFALAWAVPGWLLFEATPTKLVHYVLPFYPALALAVGLVWTETATRAFTLGRRILFWLLGALGGLILLVIGGYGYWLHTLPLETLLLGLAALIFGLALAFVSLRARLAHAALAGLWIAGAGLTGGALATIARIPGLWPARAIVALIPPDPACKEITLYQQGYDEPSLIFLAPGPVIPATPQEAAAKLVGARCAAAVVPVSDEAVMLGARRIGSLTGLDLGTGRWVALSVFAPEPAK